MELIGRVGWYMTGLLLGVLLVLFFFGDRKIPFHYLPQARVKRNIGKKKLLYSYDFKNQMHALEIDLPYVRSILRDGNVYFSKSRPREKPCGIYHFQKDSLALIIENCDSLATIVSITNLKKVK